MDSDGELRLTIMATLAQEESRKKNNGHTIQRDCVTVIYIISRPAPVERPARCGPQRRGGCCKGFCRGSGAESRLPPA